MYSEEERNRINAGFYIFLFDNTHHSRRGCGDMGMRLADMDGSEGEKLEGNAIIHCPAGGMDGYIFLRVLSTDGAEVLPLIPKQIF